MPNCRRAAEKLAEAFVVADELAHWEGEDTFERLVGRLAKSLDAFFTEMGRRPFEGYAHDIASLRLAIGHQGQYARGYVNSYAEDLQKQILSQGLLDLIDCQTRR